MEKIRIKRNFMAPGNRHYHKVLFEVKSGYVLFGKIGDVLEYYETAYDDFTEKYKMSMDKANRIDVLTEHLEEDVEYDYSIFD